PDTVRQGIPDYLAEQFVSFFTKKRLCPSVDLRKSPIAIQVIKQISYALKNLADSLIRLAQGLKGLVALAQGFPGPQFVKSRIVQSNYCLIREGQELQMLFGSESRFSDNCQKTIDRTINYDGNTY